MLKKIFSLLLISLVFTVNSFAAKNTPSVKHVIYVTLDGTRWQDVFLDHSRMPKLWQKYANIATFYGAPNSNTTMETASIPVSLPSYQSQTAGVVLPCPGNECGPIAIDSFLENLVHTLHLKRKDVATFGSWFEIRFAAEHSFDETFVNTANTPVVDPDTQIPDAVMTYLNYKQATDRAGNERHDKYTIAQALHYFQKYQPTFLWISLDDADDAAHDESLERYHAAILQSDDAIDKLLTMLKVLKLDKETMVIVTTDHGRGDGKYWTTHGVQFPESKRTWAFVINGQLKPMSQEGGVTHYSTLSIRPTVEGALGV